MRNSFVENLSQHSFEVALIVHALATISSKRLGRETDAKKLAVTALYHDAPEILTGDMPTPVKYHDQQIKTAYKQLEKQASKRLLELLPDDLVSEYAKIFNPSLTEHEQLLLKAADKISALIKCLEEGSIGNQEFSAAKKSQLESLRNMNCEAADIFIKEFLPGFGKTLDEQTVTID